MRNEIHSLQILRGIAAMMVVTNHFWGPIFGGVFKFNGGFGVDIFFVLSGFLMVHTQTESRGPIKFFLGRVKRIYPLYIILTLPLIFMHVKITDYYPFLSNLLLLPSYGSYHHMLVNPPAWTLVYEMIFYLFFSLSLIVSRDSIKACFITVSIIVSSIITIRYAVGMEPRYGWIHLGYLLGDKLMLDFAAGAIIAILYRQLNIKSFIDFRVFMLLSVIITYISLYVINDERIYKYGLPAMAMIMVAVYTKEGSGLFYKTLHLIGDASFSIYLFHVYFQPTISATLKTNASNTEMAKLAVLALTFMCVLAGIFINRTIEKPIINFFQKRNVRKKLDKKMISSEPKTNTAA